MTKAKLITPRFLAKEIIGMRKGQPIWPGSDFVTGQIIELSDTDASGLPVFVCNSYNQEFFWRYHNLFRVLAWFEYREVADLPKYVKHRSTGEIYRVTKWVKVQDSQLYKAMVTIRRRQHDYLNPVHLYPATLAEYKKQKESK